MHINGTRCFPLSPLSLKLLALSQDPVLPEIFLDIYVLYQKEVTF